MNVPVYIMFLVSKLRCHLFVNNVNLLFLSVSNPNFLRLRWRSRFRDFKDKILFLPDPISLTPQPLLFLLTFPISFLVNYSCEKWERNDHYTDLKRVRVPKPALFKVLDLLLTFSRQTGEVDTYRYLLSEFILVSNQSSDKKKREPSIITEPSCDFLKKRSHFTYRGDIIPSQE